MRDNLPGDFTHIKYFFDDKFNQGEWWQIVRDDQGNWSAHLLKRTPHGPDGPQIRQTYSYSELAKDRTVDHPVVKEIAWFIKNEAADTKVNEGLAGNDISPV